MTLVEHSVNRIKKTFVRKKHLMFFEKNKNKRVERIIIINRVERASRNLTSFYFEKRALDNIPIHVAAADKITRGHRISTRFSD